MLYIKDFCFRLQYFLISAFIIAIFSYVYKSSLLTFLISSVLHLYSTTIPFYFYSPTELFSLHIFLFITVIFIFSIPFLFWQIIDFLKSSCTKDSYLNLKNLYLIFFISFYIFNISSFFFIFPNIWFFFDHFNNYIINQLKIFEIVFELSITEYFYFLLNFIFSVNFFLIFVLTIFVIMSILGIRKLFKSKKIFIFLNILSATLFSTPEIYSQIFLFLFLTFTFELMIIFFIYNSKLNLVFKTKLIFS